jgi:hypothetical protein
VLATVAHQTVADNTLQKDGVVLYFFPILLKYATVCVPRDSRCPSVTLVRDGLESAGIAAVGHGDEIRHMNSKKEQPMPSATVSKTI